MAIDPKSIHCVLCASGEHDPSVHEPEPETDDDDEEPA